MRRLQPFQLVEVCATSSFDAHVIALDRRQIALHPKQAIDVVWLPPESPDVLLLFRHEGQRVLLKGSLHHRGDLTLVGFVVTDRVWLPAPSTRVQRCAPIALVELDDALRPTGPQQWLQTATFGADGATLESGCPFAPGTRVGIELALPTEEAPVELVGVVGVGDDDERVLDFVRLEPEQRAQIHRYVVDEQLTDLRRKTSPQEVAYVW